MNNFEFEAKPESDYIPITKLWDSKLGVLKNIKYLILELFFSAQITELLTDTNSVQLTKSGIISGLDNSKADNGFIGKLSKFIPPSIMTKAIEKHLCEMLFHKYVHTYGFLINSGENILESGSNRLEGATPYSDPKIFRLNKLSTTQLSAYRGKLNFIWVFFETSIATTSWISTNSLEVTLLLTGIAEFTRRFRI
ncbi:hypothetical protein GOP97_18760 [Vibrio cholerae]|uniref:hypothetical protein n=1 Tax=Vibrio cholerae TaxID=666 RepID=UPI002DBE19E8|nr:hypothetical protein [Vibrio cholerae]MEB5557772.1 hypothetical protein [Vibrio cholerae]